RLALRPRPAHTASRALSLHDALPISGEAAWSVFGAAWPSGDPGGIDPVRQGRAAVQDEGSQLAALALALGADELVRAEDDHWLDLCAGPGGKTALLGGLTVGPDTELLAVELQPHRTELVDRSVASLREAGCEITTRT